MPLRMDLKLIMKKRSWLAGGRCVKRGGWVTTTRAIGREDEVELT